MTLDRAAAAKILRQQQETILLTWERRARENVDAAKVQSSTRLRDSLPKFIAELIDTLLASDPKKKDAEIEAVAREHGEDRADQKDYSLDEVIYEYHLLRATIIDCLQTNYTLDLESCQIIHHFIDRGIQGSAVTYAALETQRAAFLKIEKERSREQLALAVSVAGIGFYDWDIVHDQITFSEQMQKDWGIPAGTSLEQVIGYVHPEDQAQTMRLIQQAIQDGLHYRTEYRVCRPDGKTVWIEAQGQVSFSDNHTALRFFGTSVDISDRKKTENRLTLERHQLETIFENAPAALVLWRGPDFIFEKINSQYQAIFPDRKLLGLPLLEACPEYRDQEFLTNLKHVFETGETFVGHEVLARHHTYADGPIGDHYYDFTYVRISDGRGNVYGVYNHALDVTERVKNRVALEHGLHDLQKERELRERFVSALTHDLRTPLAAVRLSTELLQRKINDLEAVRKFSDRIILSIDRADRMIRDLLDANRLKAGESLPLTPQICDLPEILSSVVENSGQASRLKIVHDGGRTAGFWDCNGVQRIIENLVSNAIKYGSTATPITIRYGEKNRAVDIHVHNFGGFIRPEDQEGLFDEFSRTESAIRSGQKGWGIGLALVRGLTFAHHGSVSVESCGDEGTTFTVHLPLDVRDFQAT